MCKNIIISIICSILGIGTINSQELSEIFGNNETLTNIFVNPLGIYNAVDNTDFDSLKVSIDELGLDYKTIDLGPYGKLFAFAPEAYTIAGVPIARFMILIQKDVNALIYQSASSENYKDMSDLLDNALTSISRGSEYGSSMNSVNIHTLSDKYGVAVGSLDNKQISMAILMDIRNIKNFLSLSNTLPFN